VLSQETYQRVYTLPPQAETSAVIHSDQDSISSIKTATKFKHAILYNTDNNININGIIPPKALNLPVNTKNN
jgi:hypothetical protein